MPSVKFVYRPSRKSGYQPGSLYIRIIHYRKIRTMTIPCRIFPDEWDAVNQSVLISSGRPERITYLTELHNKLIYLKDIFIRVIQELDRKGNYTVDDIASSYRNKEDTARLLNYAHKIGREKTAVGKERTARAYMTVVQGLIEFNKGKDLPLAAMDASLMRSFEDYLRSNGKAPNTISYYMRNLRAIYKRAVAEKRIPEQPEYPFATVFTGFRKTNKRALAPQELERLSRLDVKNHLNQFTPGTVSYRHAAGLYRAWRYFFFCFYARGMCFVDLAYLRKSNIRSEILTYYRHKTDQLIEVKVTARMREIIDSFEQETRFSDYVFPIITDPDKPASIQYETAMRVQNRRLKKLARMAGISTVVSTHVARHTWATLGKYNNLPLSVISEGLGHTSQKTTYNYLKSLDRSVLDQANEVITGSFETQEKDSPQGSYPASQLTDLIRQFVPHSQRADFIHPLISDLLGLLKAN